MSANFTTTFAVDQTPEQVFEAITNVRGWWSQQIDGDTARLGAEFTYQYRDLHYCKFRITELVPGRKVAWLVLDNYLNPTEDKTEWNGTTVIFEVDAYDGRTHVRFTHEGLVPAFECYDLCSSEWNRYLNGSLKNLIENGVGAPNPFEGDEAVEFSALLAG